MIKLFTIILFFSTLTANGQFVPSTLGFNKPTSGLITYLYDTFTGTDGTNLNAHTMNVGSGWTQQVGGTTCASTIDILIQSNRAVGGVGFYAAYTANAGVSDCVASADLVIPNTSNYLGGIIFRWTDCSAHWVVGIERDAGGTPYMVILEKIGNTYHYRSQVNVTGATNTTVNVKVTLSGNSIVALASTGETCNYTSSTGASQTLFGVWGFDGSGYTVVPIDNFLVTNM